MLITRKSIRLKVEAFNQYHTGFVCWEHKYYLFGFIPLYRYLSEKL